MDESKMKFSKVLFKGAFVFNPVLTQAIGMCTVVAICTTLKVSLAVSAVLFVLLVINEILASLLFKKLSRWLRVGIYMLLSTLILIPAIYILDRYFSGLYAGMGIYLPLLAVNSIIVIRCEKFAVNNPVKYSFYDAVAAGIGFASVAVITGTVRELLAFGTLYEKHITELPLLSGMALPFGGLLTVGFLAAFQKWILQKKFRGQPTNAFNLRTSLDTPVLRNDGLHSTDGSLSFIRDPEILEEEKSNDTETDSRQEEYAGIGFDGDGDDDFSDDIVYLLTGKRKKKEDGEK